MRRQLVIDIGIGWFLIAAALLCILLCRCGAVVRYLPGSETAATLACVHDADHPGDMLCTDFAGAAVAAMGLVQRYGCGSLGPADAGSQGQQL